MSSIHRLLEAGNSNCMTVSLRCEVHLKFFVSLSMLQKIKDYLEPYLERLPKPVKNFFVFTLILFVLWMLLIDRDSMPRQLRKWSANRELREEVNYFESKIEKSKEDLEGLKNNPDKLERLAREKYYMHKETEDVYVIEKLDQEDQEDQE